MSMFCIKCGKEAAAGNFCQKCFMEKNKLFEIADFMINFCPTCEKYSEDTEAAVRQRIKTKNRITDTKIAAKRVGNRLHLIVKCVGFIKPLKSAVTESRNIVITVKKLKCENCIKLLGGYYEAVFQVRGDRQERILNKIKNLLPSGQITDVIKLKEGYNIKIVSKGVAHKALKELREHFIINDSYKLVGEKHGKKLFRNVYAIR